MVECLYFLRLSLGYLKNLAVFLFSILFLYYVKQLEFVYLSVILSQCKSFMFCINCFFHLFPLLSLPSACDCNGQGSADMQCDRRTGQCVCLTGISGYKCDRCDRGTTGELPNCKPCGECFDNWDRVIRDLRGIVPPQILNIQFILYIISIYKLMKD